MGDAWAGFECHYVELAEDLRVWDADSRPRQVVGSGHLPFVGAALDGEAEGLRQSPGDAPALGLVEEQRDGAAVGVVLNRRPPQTEDFLVPRRQLHLGIMTSPKSLCLHNSFY